jgi:hypothetical protein
MSVKMQGALTTRVFDRILGLGCNMPFRHPFRLHLDKV